MRPCFKRVKTGAGELLRALVALALELSLTPSTHLAALVSGSKFPLLTSVDTRHARVTHIHTCRQKLIYTNLIKKKKKKQSKAKQSGETERGRERERRGGQCRHGV